MDFQSFFFNFFFSPWASITHAKLKPTRKKRVWNIRTETPTTTKRKNLLNYSASHSLSLIRVRLRWLCSIAFTFVHYMFVACVGCDLSARLVRLRFVVCAALWYIHGTIALFMSIKCKISVCVATAFDIFVCFFLRSFTHTNASNIVWHFLCKARYSRHSLCEMFVWIIQRHTATSRRQLCFWLARLYGTASKARERMHARTEWRQIYLSVWYRRPRTATHMQNEARVSEIG